MYRYSQYGRRIINPNVSAAPLFLSDHMVISCNELGKSGRLGNALFQYAASYSLAKKNNCEFVIDSDLFNIQMHGQKCSLYYFKISSPLGKDLKATKSFRERHFIGYDPLILTCDNDVNLQGWFQSELYFKEYKDDIMQEFELQDDIEDYAKKYISSMKAQLNCDIIIGVHMRRGDDVENERIYAPKNDITPDSWLYRYLESAFSYFNEPAIFLVFTGGSHTNDNQDDTNWCRRNVKKTNVVFSENESFIHDFAILSHCDHIILNSHSTFGWWASYINYYNNPCKIIVPTGYYIREIPCDWSTYWPEEFIKINIAV